MPDSGEVFVGSMRDSGGRVEFKKIEDGDQYILPKVLVAFDGEVEVLFGVVNRLDVFQLIRKNGEFVKLSVTVSDSRNLV